MEKIEKIEPESRLINDFFRNFKKEFDDDRLVSLSRSINDTLLNTTEHIVFGSPSQSQYGEIIEATHILQVFNNLLSETIINEFHHLQAENEKAPEATKHTEAMNNSQSKENN